MRLREAILADLPRLKREAKLFGKINIRTAPKGAAQVPPRLVGLRWMIIFVKSEVCRTGFAQWWPQPAGTERKLPRFLQGIVRPARDIPYAQSQGFHELRAAYACERYEQITIISRPSRWQVQAPQPTLDREARLQISYELGHGRIEWYRRTSVASMSKPFDMELSWRASYGSHTPANATCVRRRLSNSDR